LTTMFCAQRSVSHINNLIEFLLC